MTMTETECAAREAARMLTNGSGCAIGVAIDYVQDVVGDRMEAADELVAALANWLEGQIPKGSYPNGSYDPEVGIYIDNGDCHNICHSIKCGSEGMAELLIGFAQDMLDERPERNQNAFQKWIDSARETITLVRNIYEDLNNA